MIYFLILNIQETNQSQHISFPNSCKFSFITIIWNFIIFNLIILNGRYIIQTDFSLMWRENDKAGSQSLNLLVKIGNSQIIEFLGLQPSEYFHLNILKSVYWLNNLFYKCNN